MIDLAPLFGPMDAEDAYPLAFRIFPKSGDERWMLETTQSHPWHLKTWPRANFRAQLINWMAWSLSKFGIQLPSRLECFWVSGNSPYAQLRDQFDAIGVFLGTPGPNRKIVVYAGRHDLSIFVKIPLSSDSAALVQNEKVALTELSKDSTFADIVPRHGIAAGHLATEDVGSPSRRRRLNLVEVARVHDMLVQRSSFSLSMPELRAQWERWQVSSSSTPDHNASARITKARNAAWRFLDSLPKDLVFDCYMAHGDFTRWNALLTTNRKVRVIDWELYGPKPLYFDVLHYFVSYYLLVSRKNAKNTLRHIENIGQNLNNPNRWSIYTGLYFAIQTLYYTSVYEKQEKLSWKELTQLESWAKIIEILLSKKDLIN